MDRWIGKVCVVTGASAGIGSAVSVALASAGLTVVGLARRANLIEELKSKVSGQGKIVSKQCDVSKPEQINTTFKWIEEAFGGVDLLVNNAGALYNGQITAVGSDPLSECDIIKTINTNVTGLVLCTRHAVASMRNRNFNGHVVNVSSVVGHYVPTTSTFNVYPCTKYAVAAFTGSLNNELAQFRTKIKTTNINPGLVVTDLASGLIEQMHNMPVLQPEDIADGVVYAVATPQHVNIEELTINAVGQAKL